MYINKQIFISFNKIIEINFYFTDNINCSHDSQHIYYIIVVL